MGKYNKRQARKANESQVAQTTSSTTTSSASNFNPDYRYVVKDLRRIGILAGTFIAVLVIISFFLH